MEYLKQRIQNEGKIVSDNVLNLDSILNHQVDPKLIQQLGVEFAARFHDQEITKVLTIESSGISVAYATALALEVPLVFARRKKTLMSDNIYCERVPSFTKGIVTDIVVSSEFIQPIDRILIIDDIIANGDALKGLINIIHRSGAQLTGAGIVIEKAFQSGAKEIRKKDIRVESLVQINSLENGIIVLA
ncbi:xanthine phosphoribosyltransferase [Chengkuizengella axinellae]|uniref:Xanthine phosphoribosyltransferase n=1 Tax=Chengkuizengella axinellae TaxID=3064388 RepID=A0ABT9IYY1_9BACL|nr:xanthine phosphoribosyltransferase [Chengkuizengella sp. 2205SS18-9]MDP5274579.1 xanthine phosphoribosyltransferase [Chengkuizengella sp. 2205SS18-9]